MLVSNTLLVFIGIYVAIVVVRVYSRYRSLGFSRTVITPFLVVGAMFVFIGVTEFLDVFAGEVGSIIHAFTMVVTSVFFLFGLRSYHKMLMKAEEKKKLSRMNLYP